MLSFQVCQITVQNNTFEASHLVGASQTDILRKLPRLRPGPSEACILLIPGHTHTPMIRHLSVFCIFFICCLPISSQVIYRRFFTEWSGNSFVIFGNFGNLIYIDCFINFPSFCANTFQVSRTILSKVDIEIGGFPWFIITLCPYEAC